MQKSFYGFYPPTQADYKALWADGLIVVDTNVLLDLYRLPKTAREEFIAVLDGLGERVWIPYQVALEFQLKRLTVIYNERKTTSSALTLSENLVAELKQSVSDLQIDKHDIGIESAPLISDLEAANKKLADAIRAVHECQLDIAASDPIRERIDKIIGVRTGAAPDSQAELDELTKDGDERYAAKIPPGFSDASKDKNPNEATFVHDGLTYQRKFGDLIVWRQLLEHCKVSSIKRVIFITSDNKEDWWWREHGKTVGPHPELVREIIRISGVELFWMYSSGQFLEHAKKYNKAKVSDTSVAEIEGVSRTNTFTNFLATTKVRNALLPTFDAPPPSHLVDMRSVEAAVYRWLQLIYGSVEPHKGFPDFLFRRGDVVSGFEAKYLRNVDRLIFSPVLVNTMLRGYLELNEGRLAEFTIVAVLDDDSKDALMAGNTLEELRVRLQTLLSRYPISGIIVGFLEEPEKYRPILHVTE